jgi:soluble lytic murein transglycosylase
VKLLLALGVTVAACAALLVFGHRGLPSWYVQSVPAPLAREVYPLEHAAAIREAAARHRLDPALVAALIYQESGYREAVVSTSGAIGLMQLRPETAEEVAQRTGGERFETADLKDPIINIRYGTSHLRHLIDRYGGDETTALAAYHAGQGSVAEWMAGGDAETLEPAAIAFDETRAYVERIEQLRTIYQRAYGEDLGPER